MRRENNRRALFTDFSCNRLGRLRCEGRGALVADLRSHDDGCFRGNSAHLENLRPAVGEPAVADDHDLLPGGKLAGDSLHAEGSAAGHDDSRVGMVDLAQNRVEIVHDALERPRHVIERAIGKDHRELHQTIGIHR